MTDISLPELALYAIGTSGFGAWVLTYLQFREERKQRAQLSFRKLFLTHDFMTYLGSLMEMFLLMDEWTTFQRGLPTNVWEAGSPVEIKSSEQFGQIIDRRALHFKQMSDKFQHEGPYLLLPPKLRALLRKICESMAAISGKDDIDRVADLLTVLSAQIREYSGLRILD